MYSLCSCIKSTFHLFEWFVTHVRPLIDIVQDLTVDEEVGFGSVSLMRVREMGQDNQQVQMLYRGSPHGMLNMLSVQSFRHILEFVPLQLLTNEYNSDEAGVATYA
jgi:hypothetical protein